MPAEVECTFRCDGVDLGRMPLIDLSSSGFAATCPPGLLIQAGTILQAFELRVSGKAVWSGEAFVVHGSEGRIGGRFTSGVVDLQHLHLGATLEGRLAMLREQKERLPSEWRAAIGDLRQLLEDVRFELEETERSELEDPLRREEDEAALFERLRQRWGTVYLEALSDLHARSKVLDARSAVVGQAYASAMLMPLLAACPMHRRAYEKPLGYAGDYRMMELAFASNLGDGLFGRFLNTVTRQYTLMRSVVAREVLMRAAVRDAAASEGEGPIRVLGLAAGPAMELRRFVEGCHGLNRPVELILLDQDRSALESAHRHLTRILLERHYGMLPVTVRCLHFSVRQMLKPETKEDFDVIRESLSGLDLVYSAGLFDYLPQPVASRLTEFTYSKLRPGGRLFHGNLAEAPDTTWIMQYVLSWPVVYRTHETMLGLAAGLSNVQEAKVVLDETRHALFLDVRKGE
jgi:extracellular factor (EF) 3-hydroxypalmitic acid methyl ester biosynthesis protein